MIETGFTFNGKHCEGDFGLLFVEDNRVLTSERVVNEYEVAGRHGTVRFPGEQYRPHKRRGSLFLLKTPASEADAQALMRKVAAWLHGPRGHLIFDHEPDKYLIAECTHELKWSWRKWMDGGLDVSFDVQPFAYNLQEAKAQAQIGNAGAMTLTVDTGMPAPLACEITNSSSSLITEVAVRAGARVWAFTGMQLQSGHALQITMEDPVGAVIIAGGQRTNALPYSVRLDEITVLDHTGITISIAYAGGSGQADVVLHARGRWK